MKSVGCDYNTKIAWLAFPIGDKLGLAAIPLDKDVGTAYYMAHAALDRMCKDGAQAIYIEQPWGMNNFRTTMSLVRAAVVIEIAARVQDLLPVTYVHPNTWRKGIFGVGARKTRAQFKCMALEEAEKRWPGLRLTDDQAEAALIAIYGESC